MWHKCIKLGVRGKALHIIRSMFENVKSRVKIRSMFENVKSRVKYKNRLSENSECYLGVRRVERLSPFLFFHVFKRYG